MPNISRNELLRKLLHMSFGLSVLVIYWQQLLPVWAFALLWLIGVTLSLSLKAGLQLGRLSRAIAALDKDDYLPAQGMVYFYTTFMLLLLLVTHYQLEPAYLLHPMLILTFADPASFFAGKGYGKTKLPFHSRKTVLGTAAGMLTAVVISLLFVPFFPAVVIGCGAMLMDVVDVKIGQLEIDDNLLIPAGAFVLRLLLI